MAKVKNVTRRFREFFCKCLMFDVGHTKRKRNPFDELFGSCAKAVFIQSIGRRWLWRHCLCGVCRAGGEDESPAGDGLKMNEDDQFTEKKKIYISHDFLVSAVKIWTSFNRTGFMNVTLAKCFWVCPMTSTHTDSKGACCFNLAAWQRNDLIWQLLLHRSWKHHV